MLRVRLRNQKLAASSLASAVEVVRWLGAVQAQDYPGAAWGVGLRAKGVTLADVDAAFDRGDILRTHVLRPTWHFVAREDLRWMVALSAPRLRRINRPYALRHGLDDRVVAKARRIAERSLEGATFLTRKELAERFAARGIAARGQALAHLLFDLETAGVLCSGPRRAQQFTYALLGERTPAAPPLAREEAIARLGTRFFRSHGPATVKDFAWWSGLTMSEARTGASLSGGEVLAEGPSPGRAAGATYLLPNYDEYLIAYKDRGAVIDPARKRNLGVFTSLEHPHHVIVEGRVAGSWRRALTPARATLHVRLYHAVTPPQQAAIRRQVQRYGRFLQLPIEVHIDR